MAMSATSNASNPQVLRQRAHSSKTGSQQQSLKTDSQQQSSKIGPQQQRTDGKPEQAELSPEEHVHEHGHSIFHTHTHSPDDGEARSVVGIFEGKMDRGSRITLIGLVVNIVLTASKGLAGWFMNSAALLAEAGHSGSDLLGDFVTLFSWRMSKRPPSAKYPYGFGKFETLGTTTVSLLLVGGALGIGAHSFYLLMHHLAEVATTLPPGPALTALQNASEMVSGVESVIGHGHSHGGGILDPNAAWFALASVVAKEWIYRATKRVADEERSGVLLANAIHHRGDAYTSAVALVAILGTWYFPTLPLDPIGGMVVALVIFKQGISLFAGSFGELTGAGVKPQTHEALSRALLPLTASHLSQSTSLGTATPNPLLSVESIRAIRSGAHIVVDTAVRVPASLPVSEAAVLEARIFDALKAVRRNVWEVRVKFIPVDDEDEIMHADSSSEPGQDGRRDVH